MKNLGHVFQFYPDLDSETPQFHLRRVFYYAHIWGRDLDHPDVKRIHESNIKK